MTTRELLREAADVVTDECDGSCEPPCQGMRIAAALRAIADRLDAEMAIAEEGAASRNACAEFVLLPALARLDAPVTNNHG